MLVHLVHSSIAQVYDMGEAGGTFYMALEYVAGVDLAHLLEQARAQGQQLPVPVALYLGQRIAEGLGYAHRKTGPDGMPLGIVHRDVSPHNVMVSYEGEVKVIDFGLAKSTARSKYTLPSTVMGKLGYMSPEQVRAEPLDHRSDIFSCGVVVWELLAGQPLVPPGTVGEMMAAMSNPSSVPALHELRPDVDPALDAVLRRALAPSAADRYARADDFARALNEQFLHASASLGAEEVGNFVRAVCPEAFAAQRKLLSRVTSNSGSRRTSPSGTLVPVHTGLHSPVPQTYVPGAAAADAEGYANTLVRSDGSGPRAGLVPASPSAGMESPPGPGRKGWAVAITLGALGLIGASAGVTAVLMNRPGGRPQRMPQIADGRPVGLPPEGGMLPHGPDDRGPPPPRGPDGLGPPPPGMGHPPPPPEPPPGPPSTPGGAIAEVPPRPPPPRSPPPPRTAPTATAAENLVAATRTVLMEPGQGALFVVARGRQAGLARGMVLQVVEGPVKNGRAKLLGLATVESVGPQRARVSPDERVLGAKTASRLLVIHPLPALAAREATSPTAPTPTPAPAPESLPATQSSGEPPSLDASLTVEGVSILRNVVTTNIGSSALNNCWLVTAQRETFRLGFMAIGEKREVPLRDFTKRNRNVSLDVDHDRIRLKCDEGQNDYHMDY